MAPSILRCPHCNAPLTRVDANDPTECPYCHALLAFPQAAPSVAALPQGKPLPVALGVIASLLLIGGIAFGLSAPTPKPPPPPARSSASLPAAPPPPPVKAPPPSPLKEVLRFGEPGTNPGQLDAPTQLAVASDGTIFVAENKTGRVQRFGADGTYQGLLDIPPDKLTRQRGVFGLAADATGHVYVNRVGDVLVYDAATLKAKRTVAGDYPDRYYHGGLAVDGSGAVYALTDRMGDVSLVKTSALGMVLNRTRVDARDVAVDGTGRWFLIGDGGLEVRDEKGQVVTKVGGIIGRSIAFDGKRRLYVATGSAVWAVGVDGAKPESLPLRTSEVALDAKGRLYALTDGRVAVYEVSLP